VNQRGDTLRVFGVGKALEEAVRGAEEGKSHFRPVDDGGETFVMAIAGFAEKHGFDAATGAQSFFDEPDALDAYESILRGQAAAQSHSELLEPAIIATGKERRVVRGTSVARDLSRRSHHRGA
jgi:hypothetical protein